MTVNASFHFIAMLQSAFSSRVSVRALSWINHTSIAFFFFVCLRPTMHNFHRVMSTKYLKLFRRWKLHSHEQYLNRWFKVDSNCHILRVDFFLLFGFCFVVFYSSLKRIFWYWTGEYDSNSECNLRLISPNNRIAQKKNLTMLRAITSNLRIMVVKVSVFKMLPN